MLESLYFVSTRAVDIHTEPAVLCTVIGSSTMSLTPQQRYDFLLQGHTEQEVDDPTMVINQGQLYCSQCHSHCTSEHVNTDRHQWRLDDEGPNAIGQKGQRGQRI